MSETTPTDAREVALRTARRVNRGALLSRELGRTLDRSGLPPRERALATDLVYGAARWRVWLDAALGPRLRDPDRLPDVVREILRLGAYEILIRETPPHAAVHSWVEATHGHAPRLAGLVNAVLRKVAPPEDPGPATRASLPGWLWRHLEASLGDRAEDAAAAMRTPAPLWLTALAPDAARTLRSEDAEVAEGPVPGTLRVRAGRPLARLRAFREGFVQPQNPASAWVVAALDAGPGERVLDLASGRGVKAAQLAAAGARVEAAEADPAKVEQARANLARLGLEVEHRVADLRTVPLDLEPARHVLLDAPCTGTGTLRGHPELATRLAPADVTDRAVLQDRLLDTAAALVAPGGHLVYAVCSLTREEGPERVAALRDRTPAFRPEPLQPPVPHLPAGDGVFLLPEGGLDGFFVARLRRAPELP